MEDKEGRGEGMEMQLKRGIQTSINMQKDPGRFLMASQKESCWSMGWGGGGVPSYSAAS